ncbi:serine hydrolase domain-containing protein [Cyclobacterium sp. 1_MG-2023]|uniref:serine hydrolase domain-containing protein n=1 Tax=Cyclobacterium sp. 1_MG-2023 TaxID=3062681 RepID=UPI0026E31AEE|nr:serine hydrolase domain-containing protein [Cyclobacterium sp. 1_MG-2023]MDO6437326.1 serine hydrolase domain-containing protein [Cyclobacterium sp. 1_MG-2023]
MNYIKAFSFFSILIISSSLNLVAQASFSNALELKIDSIFGDFNDINKPGATVAVVKNQKIVFKKGYGSANLEYGIQNSPATIFHIASVSKQFTVFSILLLEKEGKLSFDDDIRKYIPEVPDFGKTITLRHLASHTSGMRDQWGLLAMAGWRQDDVITKAHILKLVSQQKELNFNPGESYMYCNTGFTLLAEVVARISGKTFAAFTEEKIFKPLNMLNTLFYDDHEKIVKNRAYSYHAVPDSKYKKSVLNFANVGATSLFTTVEDLALWAMNFSSLTVGDKAIIDKMNTLAVLNNGETFGGAYGQFVNKYKGLNQIQHDGVDAGFRSYLGRFPDQNFSVMVFSNLGQSNPMNLALQVADLYLNDAFEKESEAVNDADGPIESHEFTPPNYEVSDLKEFVGAYYSPELNTSYEAVLKDGKLTFTHHRAEDIPGSVVKNDRFRGGYYSFKFERNDKQQITGFRISSGRVQNLWFKKIIN